VDEPSFDRTKKNAATITPTRTTIPATITTTRPEPKGPGSELSRSGGFPAPEPLDPPNS
jgi:hypothetical protein